MPKVQKDPDNKKRPARRSKPKAKAKAKAGATPNQQNADGEKGGGRADGEPPKKKTKK